MVLTEQMPINRNLILFFKCHLDSSTQNLSHKHFTSRWISLREELTESNGSELKKFIPRLVTRGFQQIYEIDYEKTCAPIVKFITFRQFLATISHEYLALHQMNVKTAFLNGDLNKDLYVEQPKGLEINLIQTTFVSCRRHSIVWNKRQDSCIKNKSLSLQRFKFWKLLVRSLLLCEKEKFRKNAYFPVC